MILFSLLNAKVFSILWKQLTHIHSMDVPLLIQKFFLFLFPCIRCHPYCFLPANNVTKVLEFNFFPKISETTEITSPSNKAYSSGTTFKRKVESQKVQRWSSGSVALKRFSVERILYLRAPEKTNTCSGPGARCFRWTKQIRGMPVHRRSISPPANINLMKQS